MFACATGAVRQRTLKRKKQPLPFFIWHGNCSLRGLLERIKKAKKVLRRDYDFYFKKSNTPVKNFYYVIFFLSASGSGLNFPGQAAAESRRPRLVHQTEIRP
jgi:hypothetical protein